VAWTHTVQHRPVAGCCEDGNEHLGPTEGETFLECLSVLLGSQGLRSMGLNLVI
jgi:hypothetical protein